MTSCQDLFMVIDSADRDLARYPNPSDYVIKPIRELRNCSAVEVMSIQMVRGEGNVHPGNAFFTLESGTSSFIVRLTQGEIATPALLASNVQDAVRTATGDATYTVVFDSTTYRLAISHPTTPFYLSVSETAGRLMGITGTGERGSGVIASALIAGKQTIQGKRGVSLQGEPYVSLYLNDFERLNSPGSTLDGSFYTIPLESRKYMERFLVCSDEKERKGRFILQPNQRHLTQFRIRFTRPDGSLYDFNGQEHTIVLRLTRSENRDYIS